MMKSFSKYITYLQTKKMTIFFTFLYMNMMMKPAPPPAPVPTPQSSEIKWPQSEQAIVLWPGRGWPKRGWLERRSEMDEKE